MLRNTFWERDYNDFFESFRREPPGHFCDAATAEETKDDRTSKTKPNEALGEVPCNMHLQQFTKVDSHGASLVILVALFSK